MIERTDGRYKAGAKLTLESPELLDDWPKSRQNVFVRNKEVSVCVGSSDGWLCVARLPIDFADDEFEALAASYGKVREAFLVVGEESGRSKGYGLIKYVSSDASAQAKHLLDGQTVTSRASSDPHRLECDWLNSSHISYGSLHSKAMYVDRLPPGYHYNKDLSDMFSVVSKPALCNVATVKGVVQDWGLVEFQSAADAEATQTRLNGAVLQGHRIRVHFCVPGVNAINIHMKTVHAPSEPSKKRALMNDTPSANVYSQLQKLAQQNPNCKYKVRYLVLIDS